MQRIMSFLLSGAFVYQNCSFSILFCFFKVLLDQIQLNFSLNPFEFNTKLDEAPYFAGWLLEPVRLSQKIAVMHLEVSERIQSHLVLIQLNQ